MPVIKTNDKISIRDMEDSRRLAEVIVIKLNRHGAGLSNLAIGYVMEVLEMNGIDKVKNLAQPDVSRLLVCGNCKDIMELNAHKKECKCGICGNVIPAN